MLLEYLERYFDLENSGPDEYLTQCPFHDDNKPSCSINVAKRLFHCHTGKCGASGNIPKLLAKKLGYSEEIVRYELNWLQGVLNWKLPNFNPESYIKKLHTSDEILRYLIEERFWSLDIIEQAKIGWDGDRVMIPVLNIFGDVVNVRKYKPKCGPDNYKVINIKGYGKNRLYGLPQLTNDESSVLFCEGEPDTVAAQSLGKRAVCGTSGSKSFDANWGRLLKGRKIHFFYDNDEAGRAGAARGSQILASRGAVVKDVQLPSPGEDLTDFIASGKTAADLERLVEDTALTVCTSDIQINDDEVYDVSLSESSQKEYYKKQVRLRVMVSGKTLAPYIIPKSVKVSCTLPDLAMCKACELRLCGGEASLLFTHKTEEILQLIEAPVDSHSKVFKEKAGIPSRCKIAKFEIKEAQNVEEAKVIPHLDFSDDDSQYVIRQVYYIGHGLESNSSYEIIGLTIPHPKTQQVTYISKDANPLEDTISSFEVDEETIKRLRIFSLNGTDTCEVK